jgi:hypothetical protein
MKIDDKVVISRLLGGWEYHENARWCERRLLHHEKVNFQKEHPLNNMVEVEAKAMLINDGIYSKGDFKHYSIQGQMGMEVSRTNVCSSKIKVKRGRNEGKRG